jgi:hypothetical protein
MVQGACRCERDLEPDNAVIFVTARRRRRRRFSEHVVLFAVCESRVAARRFRDVLKTPTAAPQRN